MTWRLYLLMAALGLLTVTAVAAFQATPGYMDADAYYSVGRQLATGMGFTEPYIWNYLADPVGLPHPSNAYWMPLASLLAAAGAFLFGPGSWLAARVGFLLVAAALPPLAAALAWSFTSRRELAITSGLLAVFPVFYLPFLPVTDTFGLYMLLGGLFVLLLPKAGSLITRPSILVRAFSLGCIAGLMHLARTDGLVWLLVAWIAVLFVFPRAPRRKFLNALLTILLVLGGYLLIMLPWFIRNQHAFGTPLAPGGIRMLWLTSYDQIFTFPGSDLTFASWWSSGLPAVFKARLWALGLNLASALGVQGEAFLFPLILLGLWHLRKDRRVQLAALAWLLTLALMTVVFPFAGARGGFFHSAAALQLVWWGMASLGLDRLIDWGRRKRGWNLAQAGPLFRTTLVLLAAILTIVVVWNRVIGRDGNLWDRESLTYREINQYLASQGATCSDVVMVANPPGYYLASGNYAIAVPDGDLDTLLNVAQKYKVIYLILEQGSVPAGLQVIYDGADQQTSLTYLGERGNARIFLIPHH
jgi:hypothetical protein